MNDNSREAVIARYTDKSRYKPEYIFGDVYIDEERIAETLKSKDEKEIFEKEFKTAKRFSEKFGYDVFMLPQKEENIVYIEKHSNPDIITGKMFIDIKNPSGSKSSIKTRFHESIHQADGVIISVEKDISVSKVKKWIEEKLQLMNKHDGFIIAIEAGIENSRKYGIFKIKGKELSLGSFPEKPRLSSPLK